MDSDSLRKKWDERYRDKLECAGSIADVLEQHQQLLPRAGRALDLACGLGGNALFLAEHGLEVHAWDISPVAIDYLNTQAQQRHLEIRTQVRDVVAQPPEANRFDVIVVSRFLERELCPALTIALKPGGLLFYQTFMRQHIGTAGPGNPRFLLAEAELLTLFAELETIIYREEDEALFIGRKPGLNAEDS